MTFVSAYRRLLGLRSSAKRNTAHSSDEIRNKLKTYSEFLVFEIGRRIVWSLRSSACGSGDCRMGQVNAKRLPCSMHLLVARAFTCWDCVLSDLAVLISCSEKYSAAR